MIINRPTYLQKLISSRHNGMIKIVTGVRRVRYSDYSHRIRNYNNKHLWFFAQGKLFGTIIPKAKQPTQPRKARIVQIKSQTFDLHDSFEGENLSTMESNLLLTLRHILSCGDLDLISVQILYMIRLCYLWYSFLPTFGWFYPKESKYLLLEKSGRRVSC